MRLPVALGLGTDQIAQALAQARFGRQQQTAVATAAERHDQGSQGQPRFGVVPTFQCRTPLPQGVGVCIQRQSCQRQAGSGQRFVPERARRTERFTAQRHNRAQVHAAGRIGNVDHINAAALGDQKQIAGHEGQ